MKKIKKAIIPAAGLGTRFLPATKAQPKEMLPIVDKPAIQYIIEEAVESGIEDIIIISGRNKRSIEDHFDKSYELEEILAKKGNWELLENIQSISNMANIHYIRQKEPLGLGHAIYCAKSFIGNEPFAVLLGDEIVQANTPCLKQLMEVYNQYSCSVIGVQKVPQQDVLKYGIVDVKEKQGLTMFVSSLVEKPMIEEAPSQYAISARYILTPEIFEILAKAKPGSGGEIQLTDALNQLNQFQTVVAYEFQGVRYDVGNKLGFVKATIDFALQREELHNDIMNYLIDLIENFDHSGVNTRRS